MYGMYIAMWMSGWTRILTNAIQNEGREYTKQERIYNCRAKDGVRANTGGVLTMSFSSTNMVTASKQESSINEVFRSSVQT